MSQSRRRGGPPRAPLSCGRSGHRSRRGSARMAKKDRPVEPKYMTPDLVQSADALKPNFNWSRPIASPGRMAVDFEERVNFTRLHAYRLARTRQALAAS